MARRFFPPRAPADSAEHLAGAPSETGSVIRSGELLAEPSFLRALSLERKRAERSSKRFLLMLVDFGAPVQNGNGNGSGSEAIPAVLSGIRETDIPGWYTSNRVLGVIFTELGTGDERSAVPILRTRVTAALDGSLGPAERLRMSLSFYWFPDDGQPQEAPPQTVPTMYPDLAERDAAKRVSRVIKRGIDVFGSAMALILLSPCFLAIAVAVKLSSPGPIFFRQRRLGRHGVPFTFLKFRSMHVHSDAEPHREFVKKYIKGSMNSAATASQGRLPYKITDDPRVTRVGRFIRRTSLDEIPQFINVLRGDMSLVGPRPPIPYEIEAYAVWHRRRLMEVQPGITGLWQVKGRSKVCFDDMVRLDLAYARMWSVRLDLKILLQTPRAVLFGGGAY